MNNTYPGLVGSFGLGLYRNHGKSRYKIEHDVDTRIILNFLQASGLLGLMAWAFRVWGGPLNPIHPKH